ncbi:NeuD/PglB/VioB family sugar acetyltransferase [Afipia clevelandensis]|uniref:Sialic acid O-acetyltransferase NeuD family sugar O-acyltransferase n=1 Tax=Afipia clevelandensis ATCC 49720 TaxID=883079 RepID=K8PDC2_9BRAD|nr:NeuD/PglB/VioB family sugar acetyltransferase [Afipia clevelandensis]EKS38724.1 sialic acid O-acetyltransferase NeuD family sugar O-acyltransferase [Afipia clevelandensis ATCC 49720]
MTAAPAGLRIFGFGGHARSVADVALASGIRQLCFADANAREGEKFLGFPIVRTFDGGLPEGWACFPAAGDNKKRQIQVDAIVAGGWPIATVISPSATIGVGSVIGAGTFIGHHAHVGPMAEIGEGCILNTGAIVEHDCIVGKFTHVSVSTVLAGASRLGDFVFAGTGSTIIDKCSVCDDVTLGAGTVVVKPITHSGVYVGVPAERVG